MIDYSGVLAKVWVNLDPTFLNEEFRLWKTLKPSLLTRPSTAAIAIQTSHLQSKNKSSLPRWVSNPQGDVYLVEPRGELNQVVQTKLVAKWQALLLWRSFLQLVERRETAGVVAVTIVMTTRTESL